MTYIRRGTTPTISFNTPFEDAEEVYVTFSQDDTIKLDLTSSSSEFSEDDGEYLIALTQADTLSLTPNALCEVQIRAIKEGYAPASDIEYVWIFDVLKDGTIPPTPEPTPDQDEDKEG